MTKEQIKTQSLEILRQLGGSQFIAMTGAKYITYDGENARPNLSFRFPGSPKANQCTITLIGDLYEVRFGKLRGTNYKIISEHELIYAHALQSLFTRVTGLDTRL